MRIAIGSDHAGYQLKNEIKDALSSLGHDVEDLGPENAERVDYPVYAKKVAQAVSGGAAEKGVLVCGSGIGMSMTANKYRGIRAANCINEYQAQYSRLHNDANILCLGERVLDTAAAKALLQLFLKTEFEGGRHAQRVAQIHS